MAILFLEGFEHYGSIDGASITADAARKWNLLNGSECFHAVGSGRYNGRALYFTGSGSSFYTSLTKYLGGGYGTITFGVALKPYAGGGSGSTAAKERVVELLDSSGNSQIGIRIDQIDFSSIMIVKGDGTVLFTYNGGPLPNWTYIEFKVYIHDSAGTLDVKINGTIVYSQTGLNTKTTGEYTVNQVRIQNGAASGSGTTYRNCYFDDLYVAEDFVPNGSTSTINMLRPNGDGTAYGWPVWTPNSGFSRYNRLVDQPCDDDATYIYSELAGEAQLMYFEDLPSGGLNNISGPVHAVAVNCIIRNTGGGSLLAQIINDDVYGSTTTEGTPFTPSNAYEHRQDIWQIHPQTSSPFTIARVNNLQAGIRHVS